MSNQTPNNRGGDQPSSRLTQRAPDTPGDTGADDTSGYGGANLVGSNVSGLEAAARSEPGTSHGSMRGEDTGGRQPIGSALADAHGRNPNAPGGGSTAGAADGALSAGPKTLGPAIGGERASAGRGDDNRSSRDRGNSRGI